MELIRKYNVSMSISITSENVIDYLVASGALDEEEAEEINPEEELSEDDWVDALEDLIASHEFNYFDFDIEDCVKEDYI